MCAEPVDDGAFDRGDGGKMEAPGDTFHRVAHRARVRHVTFDQLNARRQVLTPADGKIVQRTDRIAA